MTDTQNTQPIDEAEMARARALLAAATISAPTAFADPLDLDALIAQARVDLAVKPEKATKPKAAAKAKGKAKPIKAEAVA